MAMLAEPRRKQKWSVDPRNSAWSNDDSKFGQKMLEKMGWSKGKGLGAQEQGNPEHIRVKVKNDVLGLGATINHEDNWIAHQDDFNQLLAELNNCHGQGETESSVKKQKKTFSLEEKSKSSKKRVHYMKFAKGKDLSSRTEQDLSCIFGRRQKSAKTQGVLQSELAALGHGDKLVPLCLSLHKHRSPAGHQECGLILFWLTRVKMGTCIAKTIGASSGSEESNRLQTGLDGLSGKGLSVLQALQY
ncbi:hypothetical protein DUI87_05638 [Hirundo rustica rustica]|uniref:G-patch domain-containing protein n=1 Tax=Hirundo rustica rustica TaxID=333673 RepID=A0A3M0KZZ1_HIRRU|nr:hypothetical protein DUI87_05638 [Hirundo rustica rustica]